MHVKWPKYVSAVVPSPLVTSVWLQWWDSRGGATLRECQPICRGRRGAWHVVGTARSGAHTPAAAAQQPPGLLCSPRQPAPAPTLLLPHTHLLRQCHGLAARLLQVVAHARVAQPVAPQCVVAGVAARLLRLGAELDQAAGACVSRARVAAGQPRCMGRANPGHSSRPLLLHTRMHAPSTHRSTDLAYCSRVMTTARSMSKYVNLRTRGSGVCSGAVLHGRHHVRPHSHACACGCNGARGCPPTGISHHAWSSFLRGCRPSSSRSLQG